MSYVYNHDPELFDKLVSACTKANARVHELGERAESAQKELKDARDVEANARKELDQYVRSLIALYTVYSKETA